MDFIAGGSTSIIPATPGSATGALQLNGPAQLIDYLVYNPSANDAVLAYGPTSTAAAAGAVIPIITGPTMCLPLPAGSLQTFTFSGSTFVASAMTLGSASIWITPGRLAVG